MMRQSPLHDLIDRIFVGVSGSRLPRETAQESIAMRFAVLTLMGIASLCTFCLSLGTLSQAEASWRAQATEDDGPIRERTIYIPYQRLRALFEKEGRGVFVPYAEFQQLWEAARRNTSSPPATQQTQRSLIANVDSIATVEGEVVSVRSTVQIELIDSGWHEIPLRLMGAALRSATIDGRSARVFQREDGAQFLLIKNVEESPVGIELVLEYSQVYQKQPGTNSVAFHPPISPIHRWEILVEQADAKIEINPKVALRSLVQPAAEASEEQTQEPSDLMTSESGTTRVEAYIGGADLVGFSWTAKSEGAAGLTALVTAQARQELSIEEGVVRTRTTIDYDISRADVDHLVLEVPADHDIVNVFDPNVQRWEKISADGLQRVDIRLFQPVRGNQSIVIELEKFTGGREMMVAMVQADIVAPTIRAVSAGIEEALVAVGRQQGVVVMHLAPTLRADVYERSGLVQIDTAQLPAALQQQTWDFAYRYATVPYSLALRVEKLLPEIVAIEQASVSLAPDRISFHSTALLTVSRAGIFQIELDVPAEYSVTEVISLPEAGYGEVAVESFEVKEGLEEGASQKLIVQLARQAIGPIALQVKGERKLDDANLLSPTGVSSSIPLAFARISPSTIKTTTGRIDVFAPESLRLNPESTKGTRPGADGFPIAIERIGSDKERMVTRLSFGRDPVELSYGVMRRKPFVEARQAFGVTVEAGVAKFRSHWYFDVQFSGVRAIRLDLPESISTDVNVEDGTLVEKVMDPQPADVAAGYVAWEFTTDYEIIGSSHVLLVWEKSLGELPIGQAVSIELPVVSAFGVDRQEGQIAIAKGESIEVVAAADAVGIRPIDPRFDLDDQFEGEQIARAFEYHGEWQLTIEATRYELEEIKRTSVERGLVRMILTRSDQVSVQALFRLRSARQRIAVRLPGVDPNATADSLDARPLSINGRSVPLERDEELFYIPYTGHSADEAVVVELRYTVPRSSLLQVPEFSEDPAIQVVDLSVYVPEEWIVLRQSGQWSRPPESWPGEHYGSNDRELLDRIRGELPVNNLGDDFPVDGTRHHFTALKPAMGSDGGLTLRTASRRMTDVVVVAVVALLGLLLSFQPLGLRVVGAASILVLALGATLVEPWLATALLRWPLFGTLGVVAAGWTLRGFVWTIVQSTQVLTRASAHRVARTQDVGADSESAIVNGNTPDPSSESPVASSEQPPIPFAEETQPPEDSPQSGSDTNPDAGKPDTGKEG